MIPDEQLVRRCLAGRPEAFGVLVERYEAYVFAVILSIIHARPAAEDIAQEAFLQMYRSLPRYGGGSFKAWAGKIALNKAIDWRRAQARRAAEAPAAAVPELPGGGDSPEEALLRQEDRERVGAVVAGLPAVYRRVITQFYFEGKDYQQIAAAENVAVRTVESRLARARRLFRQTWEEGWHEAL